MKPVVKLEYQLSTKDHLLFGGNLQDLIHVLSHLYSEL